MWDSIIDFFMGSSQKTNNFLYKTNHLITLFLVVIASIVIVSLFKNKNKDTKYKVLVIFASILLFFEITSRIVSLAKGKDFWTSMLPLHFCSVMVWVIIIATFTKNKTLLNISALGGLLATSIYLLYPAVGLNAIDIKFSDFYSIFSHSLGFVAAIYLMFGGMVSYKWKDILQSVMFFAFILVYSAIFNFIIYPGSNYMYYVESPLPAIKTLHFQILLVVVVVTYVLSFYTIYSLIQKLKTRRKIKRQNSF